MIDPFVPLALSTLTGCLSYRKNGSLVLVRPVSPVSVWIICGCGTVYWNMWFLVGRGENAALLCYVLLSMAAV